MVCEGRRSASREELGIHYERRPYPHTALAARLRCERAHGGVARQWFRGDEILPLLPMGGEQATRSRSGLPLPHERAQDRLARPHAELAQQASSRLGEQALGAMTLVGQRRPAGRWSFSRADR